MRLLPGGSIHVVEDREDLTALVSWLERQHTVSLDTETTGLGIYREDFKLRLLQFGTPTEAWVVQVEKFSQSWLAGVLGSGVARKRLVMHNASYDIQVLARSFGWRDAWLWSLTRDTRIIAHHHDPRGREEGGVGHSLSDLVARYIPEHAKLSGDLKEEFLRLKQNGTLPKSTPLAKMFEVMPIDNEMYLYYAGTDAIITAQLWVELTKDGFLEANESLIRDDHKTAMIASRMDAKGFLLDEDYTRSLWEKLREDEWTHKEAALELGLGNINSPQQVAEALLLRGIVPTELTPKGNPKVDKNFLKAHAEDPLVQAIIEGKKAGKWRTTWIEKFLDGMGTDGRVHPATNTLRARTARFSITGIPAQTLPSNDSMVRSCYVADTGERMVGVDYAQQELRFAAAKAPDSRMIRAFKNGEDLHVITAETAWPGRGLEMRKYGKGGNFGTVYGGGVNALMSQFDMDRGQASAVIGAIRKAYPGLKILGDRLSKEAEKFGYITTWTGRKLPVDPNRLYAALNYYVQSGCRDVTAHAMMRLYDAGYLEHMRLVIHDEILFSLPLDADVREVERIMSTKIGPLEIPAEAKVGSRSWGSLYQ